MKDNMFDKIESIYDAKLGCISYLMKSILNEVFWDYLMSKENQKDPLELQFTQMVCEIVNNSKMTEREDGEDYPICDMDKIKPIIARMKEIVNRGIQKENGNE